MLGRDDHPDATGLEPFLQPVGHLHRQALLHLQVAGEEVDDPAELREADDLLTRQIGDLGMAVEGQQVMSTQGLEGDVPDQDQFVVALVVGEGGRIGVSCRWSDSPAPSAVNRSAAARSAAGRSMARGSDSVRASSIST